MYLSLGVTLDVAVHRIADSGSIKEIDEVTGGPHGGIRVNEMFVNLLNELIGKEKVTKYSKQNSSDWLALMNGFESKKQGFRMLKDRKTNIRVPPSFSTLTKKIKSSAIKRYGENEIVLKSNEYICLSLEVMKGFFKPVLDRIKDHLRTMLRKPKLSKVKTMLLVGGFVDSALLQEELRNQFSKRYRILVPRNAVTAVLKGAVLFGKNPAKITESKLAK